MSFVLRTDERNPPKYRDGYDDIVANFLTSDEKGTVYPLVNNQTDKQDNKPTQWSYWDIIDIGDGWSFIKSSTSGRFLTIRRYDVVALFANEANEEQRRWQLKRSPNARNQYHNLFNIYNVTHGGVYLEGAQHAILLNSAKNGNLPDGYNPRLHWVIPEYR
jgi:hypothetical protein